MPVAMMIESILLDVGHRGCRANIRCWQKNRTDDRVDRRVGDHAEKKVSNQIENDVETEEKMTDFFVSKDIVVNGRQDHIQFEDDIHTDQNENEEDRN